MKSYHLITLLRILLFSTVLCTVCFGKIFHGMGIQMKNDGTGIYYKPGLALNYNSHIIADIGFHFDSAIETVTYYGYSNQNRSVFMEISGGYKRELFKENIAGAFRPVFIFQGGSTFELKTLSLVNIPENWFLIYAVGTGIQFYNGRILNEILLKINHYFLEDRNVSFQLSIYWI